MFDFCSSTSVVDRDREDLLRSLLADHVVVEEGLDLDRGRQGDRRAVLFPLGLFGDDVVAELDALVADIDRRASNQLTDLALPLPTEGAGQVAVVMAVLPAHLHLLPASLRVAAAARQPPGSAYHPFAPKHRDVMCVAPENDA